MESRGDYLIMLKKLFICALAAFTLAANAATTLPVGAISGAGSTSGQVPVSSGPTTAPTWGRVATISNPNLTGTTTVQNLTIVPGTNNAQFTMNTSGGMSIQLFANDSSGYGFYNFGSTHSGLTFNKTTDVGTFFARPIFGTATPWDNSNLPSPVSAASPAFTGTPTAPTASADTGLGKFE